ncbi:hypothetical protein KKA13_02780 [Patescibacteria group bacterium]|nr:hypothetical protein [Patescibacteria group bacterium]
MRDSSIYRTSIERAWQLTWRHKELWILGILAVFLGQFGLGDFIGNLIQQTEKFFWPSMIVQLPEPNFRMIIGIVWAGIILAGLGIIIFVASVISQGALIAATAEWYKKGGISSLLKLWRSGIKNFWPIALINIIRKFLLLCLATLFCFFWIKFGMKDGWGNNILMIVILAITLLLAMAVSATSIYALGYATIDRKGIALSLMKGAKLFWHHILVSLELNILLFLISLILIVIIFPIPTILIAPSMIVWSVASLSGYTGLLTFGVVLGWFVFLAVVALIGGIFNTFATSAWIYVFMKMHHEGVMSRIFHHLKNIFRR